MKKILTDLICGLIFILIFLGFIPCCLLIRAYAAETTKPVEQNPYRAIIMTMSPEESTELEQVLYLEGHIDTFEGKVAIVQVVMNRVLSDKFPNSVHEVLSQRNPVQYSTYKKRKTALPDEEECDAIAYVCNAESMEEFPLDLKRIFQDMNPIGKNPIKVGKQYYGY